jgi:hypothetical protein
MGERIMARKATWKAVERELARRLGGERIPVNGRRRGSAPDIAHDTLSLEIKHREALPAWLHDAMAQAVASKRGTQIPVVILHECRSRHEDDFVILRLGDFIDAYIDKGWSEEEGGETEH